LGDAIESLSFENSTVEAVLKYKNLGSSVPGSRFRVKGLQPIETVHDTTRDPGDLT
jgi:hypothetical protein